ncbi:MAG: PAS domain-containing protein [Chthoniobacterales bacterium]|nr:PAS domain-containing protein [Chthoniobacterales bacterium]
MSDSGTGNRSVENTTEQAIIREQRAHRIAMQVAKIGTWTRDFRTGVVEWSPELTELFGLTPEQAPRAADEFTALVHPDDRARFGAEVAESIRLHTDYHFDFRYRHSSGEYRWMAGRGRGFYDENGEIVEQAGVGIDITEQYEARELAKDRASLLRQIGDNLPHGALYQVIATPEGARQFVYWSAGIGELIGVSADEALADPVKLYQLIHPEDVPRVQVAEQVSLEGLSSFDETLRIQHAKTGEWRWVRLRSAPRRLPDGRVVWDGIYADVTDQKHIAEALMHSLERLDLAQQAGHIGVFDWNVETGTVIWNDEEHRIFGLELGTFGGTIEAWEQRVLPEDSDSMQQAMRAAMSRCEPQMDFAFCIVTPAGELRSIEGAARFSYSAQGKPLRMVGVNIDVTERLRAENALRAADRRKNEFIAMLSHELRNPLAAISNALELTAGKPDAATFEWSNIIMRRQVAHLAHLVDDLLDVTRITSGKIQLRTQRLDLADVLDSSAAGLRLLFAQRNQELIREYPRDSMPIDADVIRLEQVLVNLLTNAAKYTPLGGKVSVTAKRDGAEVVLSIKDNGVGIPQEMLGEMFELFAQGRRSIARSEGGLGLGLTISRTLVEMHGGTIVAQSEGEGLGSEFIVRLPVAEGPVPEAKEHPPIESETSGSTKKLRRLLVVDDHVDTAQSLARLLRLRGNEVEIVHDGDAAITAAKAFQPEVILLDLGLPGMDGYEVAEQLRRDSEFSRPMIIAISGYGQEEDRRRSREAGIDHHLVKPVSFAQLDGMLRHTRERD